MAENPPVLPDMYQQNSQLFLDFIRGSRAVTSHILSSLSDALDLAGEARFADCHRDEEQANCSLNLFCYPRGLDQAGTRFGQNKHTDNGSLTLLFSKDPGLEVLSPGTGRWGRVVPRPGHAVVNVGDTLRFLSRQRLYSAIHRVIPTFENQRHDERLAIGYFLRADDKTTFHDDRGTCFTAREWHDQKYYNYMASHLTQRSNTILTGGMEEALHETSN